MDQSTFWRLIAKIDNTALIEGDEEEAVEPLTEAPAQHSEADIREFENILAQFLYDIDGKAYADEAGDSGGSADGFLYARCYVVARGNKHYEAVKASPSRMPKTLSEWCESLLYVAQQAWAAKTGNDEEDWEHDTPANYETGSNRAAWEACE